MKSIKLVYGQHYNNYRIPECYFLLQHALLSQGISADLVPDLIPNFTNIIVEGFKESFAEQIPSFKQHENSRLYIICTEYLTEGTFNKFSNTNNHIASSHYDQNEYWLNRFVQLEKVIPFCDGIFHLSELQVKEYQKEFPNTDVMYLPHGAIESLKIAYPQAPVKDIDILFTGVLTKYRKNILNTLESNGLTVKMCDTNTPEYLRSDLTRRSKISLNLLQKDSWLHPSNSRFHYHLTNQSCLISQTTIFKCDLSKYVFEVEKDGLLDYIQSSLVNDNYLKMAARSHQNFFNEMGMKQFMPKILTFLGDSNV